MTELDILIRLFIAAIFGGIIGYERESFHKPAGLRTHAFVSMGSALFTVISLIAVTDMPGGTHFDPSRVIAAIVTGVGFIGAGAIIHRQGREDAQVEGITTAAGLWVASAIGLTVGLGYYFIALNSVLLSLVVLLGLSKVKPKTDKS